MRNDKKKFVRVTQETNNQMPMQANVLENLLESIIKIIMFV